MTRTKLKQKPKSIGTITDISPCEDTKAGGCKPYDIKVLFKKIDPQAEIQNLLEFENIVVPITCNKSKHSKHINPPIKPLADVPDTNNQNIYPESEPAKKKYIEQKKNCTMKLFWNCQIKIIFLTVVALQPSILKKNG
ncbi:hypothetical protein BB561_003250 [Smittium simulii]|uniref:Uncharacterized protein n=1 Tax=Smittium simulii TaxID=133385 RepID=A0A2T9YMD5_9FUNG|nr:hypothetical protein BB561_003250 [Smittium simulii]